MHAPVAKPFNALRRYLQSEATGGIVLMLAAAAALIVANSGAAEWYEHWRHDPTGPTLSPTLGPMNVELWINDGLMAFFFLLVGLEIKRELVDGALAQPENRRLPVIAAASGMIVPALVYLFITRDQDGLTRGWAIPAATDIAFAIGVMALLGKRVPAQLKLFLTTVAIVDDMGAVAIIALAYSHGLSLPALAAAAGVLAVMWALGRHGVRAPWVFLLGFVVLWFFVLRSGVHATIAGVLAAAVVPITPTPGAPDAPESTLHRIEHGLAPWSAFLIVPLFGFANAGVALTGIGGLGQPLVLAVALGLFLGKQLGILGAVWAAVKLGIAGKPGGCGWGQVYGVALLAGIGFTMSLFIGGLAFPGRPELIDQVKLGVIAGSALSAVMGYAVLRLSAKRD
ncbi:Na+/H+ antiporter NhaA [Sphingomonas lenta]|uniref:Na(+)/H(+) antiporter NhaA n=1 Tax=Sphingomonas lenta TaxID=1141887 RepID=A0A2A2SC52_9SPHN|nr:Na+/H+ antiporter NhaA [Sphingomonas lenta]PAX06884.1 Na+/H+ antiporter NhaA [Sphingomonas lenta]